MNEWTESEVCSYAWKQVRPVVVELARRRLASVSTLTRADGAVVQPGPLDADAIECEGESAVTLDGERAVVEGTVIVTAVGYGVVDDGSADPDDCQVTLTGHGTYRCDADWVDEHGERPRVAVDMNAWSIDVE